MLPSQYTRIVLNERPEADITPTTFKKEVLPFDLQPSDGEVLVQVTWLSLDPAMRGWIRDVRSYIPPVKIGEVMRSQGLGVVIAAGKGSSFQIGDLVRGFVGWTEYAVLEDKQVEKFIVPKGTEPLDFLNTLGSSGMTAYFGLKDVGKLKAGETLLVSGAAGSVGSLACQMGKKTGAKVYAIAGSQSKCEWLEKELGVEMALNYKSPTFKDDLKKIGYLDVYFDNVGGEILDMVLTRLNKGARIVLCGAISEYNSPQGRGLQNYSTLISQRARIEGFIILDYAHQFPAAAQEISKWLEDGSLKRKYQIVTGLGSAPTALPMLFSGANTGKLVVRVSQDQAKF